MLCFTSGIKIDTLWEIHKNKCLKWIACIACLHVGHFSSADLSDLTGFPPQSDAVRALQLIHRSVYELTIYSVTFHSPSCITNLFIPAVMFIYVGILVLHPLSINILLKLFAWQLQVCCLTHLSNHIPVKWQFSNFEPPMSTICHEIKANVQCEVHIHMRLRQWA